jgi:predicted ATPase with chaperone activity
VQHFPVDFKEVCGQMTGKRALEVSCAGGHNLLMIGPSGSGKTMVAKRIPTILPPLTFEEALETTKIHSVAGVLNSSAGLVGTRPYGSPQHTISDAGLIGGGTDTVSGRSLAGTSWRAVSRRIARIPAQRAQAHATTTRRRLTFALPGRRCR